MCPTSNSSNSGEDSRSGMDNPGSQNLLNLQRKTAMLDNIGQITPFSGEGNSVSLDEFLDSFDRLANLFKWDEEEKLFALATRLTGTAARILRNNKNKNFAQLISILKGRFCRIDPPDVALAKFLAFKQTPDMSVQDFYDSASDLAEKALVVDGVDAAVANTSQNALLFSMLLNNLLPEIRRGVIVKDPKTHKDILQYALLEEKAQRSISSLLRSPFESTNPFMQQPITSVPQNACAALPVYDLEQKREIIALKDQLRDLSLKFDTLLSKTDQNNAQAKKKREVTCFFCNIRGHVRSECRKYRAFLREENFQRPNRGRGAPNFRPQQNYQNRGEYLENDEENVWEFQQQPNFQNSGRGRGSYQSRGHPRQQRQQQQEVSQPTNASQNLNE